MSLPSRRTPAAMAAAISALVLITGLALAGCSAGQAAQTGPSSSDPNYVSGAVGMMSFKVGQRPDAPRVAGVSLTGQRLSLSGYHGKVVVLNFWASWCPPCRSEAPALAQLSRAYQAKGVQFIGVNTRDPGQANGEAYERTYGVTYPSLYDPAEQVLLAFHQTVPPSGIPSTLVIDRSGHIAARIIGPVDYTTLKSLLGGLVG